MAPSVIKTISKCRICIPCSFEQNYDDDDKKNCTHDVHMNTEQESRSNAWN